MLARNKISKYRQRLRELLKIIEKLTYYSAYPDPLIKGTPGEVYKKCGKKECKCNKNPKDRHGPYGVVQIYRKGKQRQIVLRKDQKEILEQAKNYQKQIKNLSELKKYCSQLEEEVRNIINQRTKECPK